MKNIPESFTGSLIDELEQSIYLALQYYSNVHRGNGHNSLISTKLYEQARDIVLDYMGLDSRSHTLIFCSSLHADQLTKNLKSSQFKVINSKDIRLAIGVTAVAVKRSALAKGPPVQSGGGTTSLISESWIVWAKSSEKFEAGTPAIVNTIMFAKALLLINKHGQDAFLESLKKNDKSNKGLVNDKWDSLIGQILLDSLKKTLIGKDIQVPTINGNKCYTNLDNSASTPTFEPVWNTFKNYYRQSVESGQTVIQQVREICAAQVGSPLSEYELIFTHNTTESINICAQNFSKENNDDNEALVLSTMMEHSSNDLPWRMVSGNSIIRLEVDSEGFINLDELEKTLKAYNQDNKYGRKKIKLLAISGASNVLGSCNDLESISRIAHNYSCRILVDGAQLIAHRQINMDKLGIDYLAFSAHKIYAPFGCGVLVARKGLINFDINELKYIHSSGEENIAGIAALGTSLKMLQRIGMDLIEKEERELTGLALEKLSQIEEIKIYGVQELNSPRFDHKLGVIVFDYKNMMADKVAKNLAMHGGIGVRNGCLCAHIIIKKILGVGPGLEKFQRLLVSVAPSIKLPGVTRISLGLQNDKADIDAVIETLNKIKPSHKLKKASITDAKRSIDKFVDSVCSTVY